MQAAVTRQGSTCGLRLSMAGMQPANHRTVVLALCRYTLSRKARIERYCSEGVEHYEVRTRIIMRQYNSQEMSS